MNTNRRAGIFFSAIIVAIGGIIYELIIGTVASYLLGNSVLQFSLTIGLFLFGMGVGSLLVPYFKRTPEEKFVIIESAIAIIGGNAPLFLFLSFAYTNLFHLFFVATVLAIGILIGFEIPTMLEIVAEREKMIQLVSRILALDYLGALVASIVFPLILLPYLGIIRTSYLVGIANLAIATLIFWAFRSHIKTKKIIVSSYLFLCFFLLSAGLVYSNQIAWFLDHKLYQDEVIYSEQTPYQKLIITRYQDDIRLFLDGSIQFSSVDEYRYHEPLVHIPLGLARNRQKILVLGGGDGLATRELLKYQEIKQITIVDLDPQVTKLSSSYDLLTQLNNDSLNDSRVKITNEDALKFLENNSETYDVIIADLPDPNNEGLAKLYSREFYRLVRRHLAEDGVFVTQATSPYFSTNTFWVIKNTIEAEELRTLPYHVNVPSFGEWGFVLASKKEIDKNQAKVLVETKFLTKEVADTLFVFDYDLLPTEENKQINTFYDPVILKTYEEDARRWQP